MPVRASPLTATGQSGTSHTWNCQTVATSIASGSSTPARRLLPAPRNTTAPASTAAAMTLRSISRQVGAGACPDLASQHRPPSADSTPEPTIAAASADRRESPARWLRRIRTRAVSMVATYNPAVRRVGQFGPDQMARPSGLTFNACPPVRSQATP